ncbi:MAG: DUF4386 domain-containing protein [bacterium]
MKNHTADTSQSKATKVAGLAYVLIIILSMLKLIFVGNLLVSENDAITTQNIIANKLLFRIGIANDIIVFLLVIVLSLALYVILKTVNKNLAFVALFMRFGEAIIGGIVTVLSGLIPLLLIKDGGVFETEQLQALVVLFLDVQSVGLYVVMIFMGLGGSVFCYLFFKSTYIPKILAAWGILTYLIILIFSFANILFPNIPEMVAVVLYTPGALFEVIIGLWLFFKGIKVER